MIEPDAGWVRLARAQQALLGRALVLALGRWLEAGPVRNLVVARLLAPDRPAVDLRAPAGAKPSTAPQSTRLEAGYQS